MVAVQAAAVPGIVLGTAGWNIPKAQAARFPAEGTHLQRYARVLPCAEINSSFYRPHMPATYERWAASVPEGFRFAVKVPKTITHTRKLEGARDDLLAFLSEVRSLGPKLGPLLVQLPPRLVYNEATASDFFAMLRDEHEGDVACEPRHPMWFASAPDALMRRYRVARVAADPAVVPEAAEPGGWEGLRYYRLHGSPRIYYSPYEPGYLRELAETLRVHAEEGSRVWCIFDNTAEGAAAADALTVMSLLDREEKHDVR